MVVFLIRDVVPHVAAHETRQELTPKKLFRQHRPFSGIRRLDLVTVAGRKLPVRFRSRTSQSGRLSGGAATGLDTKRTSRLFDSRRGDGDTDVAGGGDRRRLCGSAHSYPRQHGACCRSPHRTAVRLCARPPVCRDRCAGCGSFFYSADRSGVHSRRSLGMLRQPGRRMLYAGLYEAVRKPRPIIEARCSSCTWM